MKVTGMNNGPFITVTGSSENTAGRPTLTISFLVYQLNPEGWQPSIAGYP
jgi:hypothetical protein